MNPRRSSCSGCRCRRIRLGPGRIELEGNFTNFPYSRTYPFATGNWGVIVQVEVSESQRSQRANVSTLIFLPSSHQLPINATTSDHDALCLSVPDFSAADPEFRCFSVVSQRHRHFRVFFVIGIECDLLGSYIFTCTSCCKIVHQSCFFLVSTTRQ